ncbi:hypothetical protein FRB97_003527 [Tulasnella sp. 331]|nr:hypothetical protein FRB97_003527 [Tulasnella sp. 331]
MILRTFVLWAIIVLKTIVAQQDPKVLVFSATNAFRHDSIPTAVAALEKAGEAHDVEIVNSENAADFNDNSLSRYDLVLFLMVTDTVADPILNTVQQQAFQDYLNKGGNFVGVHASSDCLHNATFYGAELGAYFLSHRTIGPATFLNNIEPMHPTVSMIPPNWTYSEEVSDPRSVGAKVVLTVEQPDGDPDASVEGTPHPIAWYQERGAGVASTAVVAGRSFYTSLGHLNSTWQDDIFIEHVMGGIIWTIAGNTTRAFNDNAQVGNPQTAATETMPPPGSGSLAPAATGSSVVSSSVTTTKTSASSRMIIVIAPYYVSFGAFLCVSLALAGL